MAQERYRPQEIEPRWQAYWEERRLYYVQEDPTRRKFYTLVMYPYPSGHLHVGHLRNYTMGDVVARYHVMRGYNVLNPMGWDAFGLPAENAALERGVHPLRWTQQNIDAMKAQLHKMGICYDWDRELASFDPDYYRWNQWFFIQFYKRGLAYRGKALVNWCPHCKTVLANEQVHEGACERCKTPVTKIWKEQWFLRLSRYAEDLLRDLDLLEDWPERVKTMQRDWIGRSEGVAFRIPIEGVEETVEVFTTRVDTVFGMTFVVLAPEHPLVERVTTPDRRAEVEAYVRGALSRTSVERMEKEERDGVFTGGYAVNPVNGERVPIWVADYVLMEYGTGAIMAVPAHDERDFDFARRYGLPIRVVVAPPDWDGQPLEAAYVEPGTLVQSGPFDGLPSEEAKVRIAEWMEERGIGRRQVQYRLRDWLISRQRYWGTPIPMVHCERCGWQPVPEEELPVLLPEIEDYHPTGDGRSPLARVDAFVRTTCPACGGPAERETDTMDTFVDSSWYFLRFCDPKNREAPFDREKVHYWMPVDQYIGGIEHATMHLIYARFWVKVLHDMGLVDFREPFQALFTQGMITFEAFRCPEHGWISWKEVGEEGTCPRCGRPLERDVTKMSKSKKNTVSVDEIVDRYGADAGRLYALFMGPPEQDAYWDPQGVEGTWRFLNRLWNLILETREATPREGVDPLPLRRRTHQLIERVTRQMEAFRFNTMVASLMEYLNDLVRFRDAGLAGTEAWREAVETFLKLLAPAAPHIAEELWRRLGHEESIHLQPWPEHDPELAREETVEIAVQVNGRVRARIRVPVDADEETVATLAREAVADRLNGEVVRTVVVPGRLVNFVVRPA